MKKTLCLVLAVIMALSCFSLSSYAVSFETENGVQIVDEKDEEYIMIKKNALA